MTARGFFARNICVVSHFPPGKCKCTPIPIDVMIQLANTKQSFTIMFAQAKVCRQEMAYRSQIRCDFMTRRFVDGVYEKA